jgi:hypothetical protein
MLPSMRTARNIASGVVIAGGISLASTAVFAQCGKSTECAEWTPLAGYTISCVVQNEGSSCTAVEGWSVECTDAFFHSYCDCNAGCS